MTIEKKDLHQLPYVDGLPVAGQSRIDWIQDGEELDGADSALTNEGALNRGSVKVQINVATLNDNVNVSKGVLDQVVDLINVHDEIINATGDGTNIYDRVTSVEKSEAELKIQVTEVHDALTVTDSNVAGIKVDIGTQEPTEPKTNVRQEIRNIKTMLGNYKGFDVNSNPDVDAPGLGVKGQVERDWETITNHETRITGLEKWWDGDTPDVLIRNARDLRNEMGPTTASVEGKTIYDRLTATEERADERSKDIVRLDVAVNTAKFPMVYNNRAGEQVTVNNIWEYTRSMRGDVGANQTDLFTAQRDIIELKSNVGKPTKSQKTAWQEIEISQGKVANLEGLVGLSPTDGLRGELATQVLKQANDYNRHDGILKSLSDVVNLDHTPKLKNFGETIDTPKTGLKEVIRGTKDVADTEYQQIGVGEAGRLMYDQMYKPYIAGSGFILDPTAQNIDSSYVRKFVNSKWEWIDAFNNDIVIGATRTLRTPQGVTLVSHEARESKPNLVVIGQTAADVAIRGKLVEPLDAKSITFGGTPAIDATADKLTIKRSLIDFHVADGESMTVTYGAETKEMLHTGNLAEFVQDIDPRAGFEMTADTAISGSNGTTTYNVVRNNVAGSRLDLGDVKIPMSVRSDIADLTIAAGSGISSRDIDGNAVGLVSINAADEIIIGNDSHETVIRAHGDDLSSVRIRGSNFDHKVWHDGLDAPADGAFYARKDHAWTAFNPGGGGGGIGEEAPNNGMQYTRVCKAGVGKWDLVGAQSIALQSAMKLTGNTNAGVVDIIYAAPTGEIVIGDKTNRKIALGGTLDNVKMAEGTKIAGRILSQDVNILTMLTDKLVIGDIKAPTVFASVPSVTIGEATHRVWHDGIDAPNDQKYYARRNNSWTQIFNGVNPDADVLINTGKSYKAAGVVVGSASVQGSDTVVDLSNAASYTKLNGKVMSFALAQPSESQRTSIRGMLDKVDVNVIAIADNGASNNQVVIGDVVADTVINSKSAVTVNGDVVMTSNAYESPKNGKRFSRRDGAWIESYYYGNFATDKPANPKEGDVFFEFVN